MVSGTVLCVIISMALQVPSLDLSAYMVFFLSQKTKQLTVLIWTARVDRRDDRHW